MLLLWSEGDSVNHLLHLWYFEVHKLHVLFATEAQILHEDLQQGLARSVTETTGDAGVEDLGLFDASGDAEELEQRV